MKHVYKVRRIAHFQFEMENWFLSHSHAKKWIRGRLVEKFPDAQCVKVKTLPDEFIHKITVTFTINFLLSEINGKHLRDRIYDYLKTVDKTIQKVKITKTENRNARKRKTTK